MKAWFLVLNALAYFAIATECPQGIKINGVPQIPEEMVLVGERTVLVTEHSDQYLAMRDILSDPTTMSELRFMAHLEKGGWTVEEVKARMDLGASLQRLQRMVQWTALDAKTQSVQGSCSLLMVDFNHRRAEFGLIIHHLFWGTGVGTECHLLALDYAFGPLGLHRIEIETLTTNERMRGFLASAGVPFEGIRRESIFQEGKFIDSAVYAILDREWPAIRDRLKTKRQRQVKSSP